jgi:hypothetical protein
VDGKTRWAVRQIRFEVGTRGALFALLFGQAKSNTKNSFEPKACPRIISALLVRLIEI